MSGEDYKVWCNNNCEWNGMLKHKFTTPLPTATSPTPPPVTNANGKTLLLDLVNKENGNVATLIENNDKEISKREDDNTKDLEQRIDNKDRKMYKNIV